MKQRETASNLLKIIGKIVGIVIIILLARPWKDKTERFNEIVLKGQGNGIVIEKYLDKTSHLDLTFKLNNGIDFIWPGTFDYKEELSRLIEIGDSISKMKNSYIFELHRKDTVYFFNLKEEQKEQQVQRRGLQ